MAIPLNLSYWVIPHVFMSRYPNWKCEMKNLGYCRINKKNSRVFLNYVANKIGVLAGNSEGFMDHTRNAMSLMK